jgi:transglutaminase-like putative cysteine protease
VNLSAPGSGVLLRLLAASMFLFPGIPFPAAGQSRPSDDAIILEESLEIEIVSESLARERYVNRTKVLTKQGVGRFEAPFVFYNPWVEIRELRASITAPDGKRTELKKRNYADAALFASYELYSDSRGRFVNFPGTVPGSILEYRYETEVRSFVHLTSAFPLQEDRIPVQSRKLTVIAPASFPLETKVTGGSPKYTREERDGKVVHRWEVSNVSAFWRERGCPPNEDLLPRVLLFPKRKTVFGRHLVDAETWDGIARFQWEISKDRMDPTPEVAQEARKLTEGVLDPDEKVRKLYEFVQSKIAYVAIELGIGGWQPHANGDVYRYRYGDCKDKATLLIAMMRAVGLEGYPVLIRIRDAGMLEADIPSSNFNHAIVAVPRPEGYLFLDPTSTTTPFGDLPWWDQGVPVLVVKPDGKGDLVETPLTPPDWNRQHRLVKARLTSEGNVEGEYTIEFHGNWKDYWIGALDESRPTELENELEDLVAWLCPGAAMKTHRITRPKGPADPLRVRIDFEIPRFATRAGSLELISPHLARIKGLTDVAAYPVRRHPIFFEFLRSETSEVRLQLPPGRTLKSVPAPAKREGPGLRASTSYELLDGPEGRTLKVLRSVEVTRREIPASEYAAVREFLSALAKEDATAVTLIPES